MSEHYKFLEGRFVCQPSDGPGFEAMSTELGDELDWGGRHFIWNAALERYDSVLPPPTILWAYQDGTYIEKEEPEGPQHTGTWQYG